MTSPMRIVTLSLILMIVLVPLVSIASAQPQNVFDVDTYTRRIAGGGEASYKWVVFNNGTSPLLVRPSAINPLPEDLKISFTPSFTTLAPGESSTLLMTVITNPNMADANITLQVKFTATPMDDPEDYSEVLRSAILIVDSNLGNVGVNAIFGIWPNPLPPPLDGNWGAFLVTIMGWILIALFFAFVLDPLVHRITRRTTTKLDDIVLKIIRAPLFIFILSYGAVVSLEILNIDRDLVAEIEAAYKVILVLLVVWVVYKVYKEIVLYYAKEYAKKTETEIDDVVVPLMEKIGLIIIPTIGLMTILSMFGYDLTALLAGVGFLGIVVGFAAQSTLANFFAGLQLLADRPFKVGDILRLEGGSQLVVKHIGMRATKLYNPDTDELVVIPNNEIANKQIINMVEPTRTLRIIINVGVAYGSDVEKVMTVMRQTALDLPNTLKDPEHLPVVRFSDFGDSSLNFRIFIWVDDVSNRFKVASEYRQELNRRFAQEGIEIPFPQRVVTIKYDKSVQPSERKG
ncbi:MAG: mechanosensitive ion channel [Methanomassiliicoccales archaeon]